MSRLCRGLHWRRRWLCWSRNRGRNLPSTAARPFASSRRSASFAASTPHRCSSSASRRGTSSARRRRRRRSSSHAGSASPTVTADTATFLQLTVFAQLLDVPRRQQEFVVDVSRRSGEIPIHRRSATESLYRPPLRFLSRRFFDDGDVVVSGKHDPHERFLFRRRRRIVPLSHGQADSSRVTFAVFVSCLICFSLGEYEREDDVVCQNDVDHVRLCVPFAVVCFTGVFYADFLVRPISSAHERQRIKRVGQGVVVAVTVSRVVSRFPTRHVVNV